MNPRLRIAVLALLLGLCLPGCATTHVVAWSKAEPSTFGQPEESKSPFVRPAGTVLALPIAFVWDVVTFPFQWLWDVHPYGEVAAPSADEGLR